MHRKQMEQIGNAQRTKGAGQKCKENKEKSKGSLQDPLETGQKTPKATNPPQDSSEMWGSPPKKHHKPPRPIRNGKKHSKKQPNSPRPIGNGGGTKNQTNSSRPITAQKHNPPSPKPRCKTHSEQFLKSRKQHLILPGSPKPPPISLTLTVGVKELQRSSLFATKS